MRITRNIIRILTASVAAALILTSCGKSYKDQYAYDDDAPSLYEAFSDYFHIGCAINTWDLVDGSDQQKIILKHFNTLTLENESKPEGVHPKEDQYNFSSFDTFVDFCEKNGITARGHTLVWHSQVPQWFFKDGDGDASAELLLERLHDHINTIVTRYKGRVGTWDVVNEVIGDDGQLRFSDWSRIVGDYDGDGDKFDFIEQAFIWAREADPDARLIINDYSLESSTDKAIRMYNAVKKMLEEGVPIDGVGFQMHIGNGSDPDQMEENYRIIARLKEINPDFIIEVTELDVNCYGWGQDPKDVELTDDFLKQFSETYTGTMKMLMKLSDEGLLDSVVFWGLHDGVSWLNNGHQNYPMLIDKDLKLKHAFYDVIDLV